MKRALLVCGDKYPNGDAGAVRVHSFAKLLTLMGYDSTVVGLGKTTSFMFDEYEGILYLSLRSPSNSLWSRVINHAKFARRLKYYVLGEENQWDVILFVNITISTLNILKKYAMEKGIPILHDCVEWYSPEQFSLGRFNPLYIINDCWNRYLIDTSIKVIAISSYLEDYFSSKRIATIRIPVIMDVQQIPCQKKNSRDKLVFTYAGSPGKKDYLDVVIESFAQLSDIVNIPYEIRLIGITEEQLSLICEKESIKKIEKNLYCYGRISREQVLEHLSQTDFTVFMRSEEQRYAKAGFPTKFVESLATATPVITNATSDLAMYLKNGENGYIVSENSSIALTKTISEIMKLSYEQRCEMQQAARQTAEEHFDYQQYTSILEDFLL